MGDSAVSAGSSGGILRAAGAVGGMTLVSRILGLVRDIAQSTLLGNGLVADAWHAAFLLPSTLRRMVGEGNISAAFIPVFARQSERRSEADSWDLAARFFWAVAIVAGVLSALGVLLAPALVNLMFYGYGAVPGKIELTVALTRAVFGYLLLISLAAVLMGVLNARHRFAAAAFTPVLLNLAFIAAAFAVWGDMPQRAVWALAAGAMVGGSLQFLFLVPFARRIGMPMRPVWPRVDPALAEIGRLMVPGVVGAGVAQINVVVGRYLASELPQGTITSLYFASRLNELALGVFAVAVATVVLPRMARQGAREDHDALSSTLTFALRQVTAVTVPAAVGLIVLRHEIVATLFEYGRFTTAGTDLTAAAVWGYAVGLAAVAGVRVAAQGFYALRDTRTPVIVASVSMVVNVIGCLVLREPLQNAGIALANSIAAFVGVGLLLLLMRRRLPVFNVSAALPSFARVAIATIAMAWVVDALRGSVWSPDAGTMEAWLRLLSLVALGGLTYLAGMVALRAPEIDELRNARGGSDRSVRGGGR